MVGIAEFLEDVWDYFGEYIGAFMGAAILIAAFLGWMGNTGTDEVDWVGVEGPHTVVIPNPDGSYQPLQYSSSDLFYMTQALYFEARSEPVECQQMVASVIVNRMYDWHYPNTLMDVIWDFKQFSYTHDGKNEDMGMYLSYQIAEEIAHNVLSGLVLDATGGGLYYHNPNLVDWEYKNDYEFVVGCGDHDFYKRKGVVGWE